jgi:diguanylate cyclase (GGDEF)-like protein
VINMKLNEAYSLVIDGNKRNSLTRKKASYNVHRNRALVILSIVFVFALILADVNPLVVKTLRNLSYSDYIMINLIVIFSFISWTVSRIVHKSYYSGSGHNKVLVEEVEKSRRLNQELMKRNEELVKLAYMDELTGIPNRRSFINFINSEYDHRIKKNSLMSIIMIDVDFFKQYNDCLGHGGADKILVAVAHEINFICKGTKGIAARYGGDEFILTSINTNEKQILEIAKTIRNRVNELIIPNNNLKSIRNISVSIGTSTVMVTKKNDMYRCIELADKALYEAKENGRNCIKNKPDTLNKQNSKFYVAS